MNWCVVNNDPAAKFCWKPFNMLLLLVYNYMCGKKEGIQNSSDQNRGEGMWGGMKTNEYFLSTILTKKSCTN